MHTLSENSSGSSEKTPFLQKENSSSPGSSERGILLFMTIFSRGDQGAIRKKLVPAFPLEVPRPLKKIGSHQRLSFE